MTTAKSRGCYRPCTYCIIWRSGGGAVMSRPTLPKERACFFPRGASETTFGKCRVPKYLAELFLQPSRDNLKVHFCFRSILPQFVACRRGRGALACRALLAANNVPAFRFSSEGSRPSGLGPGRCEVRMATGQGQRARVIFSKQVLGK